MNQQSVLHYHIKGWIQIDSSCQEKNVKQITIDGSPSLPLFILVSLPFIPSPVHKNRDVARSLSFLSFLRQTGVANENYWLPSPLGHTAVQSPLSVCGFPMQTLTPGAERGSQVVKGLLGNRCRSVILAHWLVLLPNFPLQVLLPACNWGRG